MGNLIQAIEGKEEPMTKVVYFKGSLENETDRVRLDSSNNPASPLRPSFAPYIALWRLAYEGLTGCEECRHANREGAGGDAGQPS